MLRSGVCYCCRFEKYLFFSVCIVFPDMAQRCETVHGVPPSTIFTRIWKAKSLRRKVVLPETVPQTWQISETGLSLPSSNPHTGFCYCSKTVASGKGLWANSACSFLLIPKFSHACPNCGLKFQLRTWLATQPTHGNGSEIPSNCGCPGLPG